MNIEELIKQHVSFRNSSSDGWHHIKCPVCNDYKVRAGFRFDNNGETCVYHCFNNLSCGGAYDPNETNGNMSKNFIKVLNAFNIPEREYKELILEKFLHCNKHETKIANDIKFPSTIPQPKYWKRITEPSRFGQLCIDYLTDRHIDYTKHDFYYTEITDQKDWNYRLIIPAYYRNNLIHYQGRDILDFHSLHYKSVHGTLSNILYNFDEVYRRTKEPLLVFEGFFDGLSIYDKNFVSICSSNLTKQQLHFLKQSPRQKIIVPDFEGNGVELLQQGIDNGFGVCFPKFKDCKDVNDAVIKYGRLFVLHQILTNVKSGYEAQLYFNMQKYGIQ